MYQITKLKEDIQAMNIYEKLILINGCLMVIHVYAFCAGMLFSLLYSLKNKNLKEAIVLQPGYKVLYGFIALELVVSAFHKNLNGFGNTLGLLLIFMYIAFFRKHLSKKSFDLMLEGIIVCSLITCVVGLFQFNYVSKLGGYSFLDFKIQNSPKKRITGGFMNANFYAMVLDFVITCCIFRFAQAKKAIHKCWYVFIGLFNFVLMYLTGCRAALLPFIVVVPYLLYRSNEKKWAVASIACLVMAAIGIYFYPNLIPRVSDTSTVTSRLEIWSCAWKGIQAHPIFGQGPMAYGITYSVFNGHKAPHCHNIYIDTVCSFGIVGTIIMLMIDYIFYKDISKMKRWKTHKEYHALAISFILITMIFGIMDCTINMPSTGTFMIMMISISALSENEMKSYSINDCLK